MCAADRLNKSDQSPDKIIFILHRTRLSRCFFAHHSKHTWRQNNNPLLPFSYPTVNPRWLKVQNREGQTGSWTSCSSASVYLPENNRKRKNLWKSPYWRLAFVARIAFIVAEKKSQVFLFFRILSLILMQIFIYLRGMKKVHEHGPMCHSSLMINTCIDRLCFGD